MEHSKSTENVNRHGLSRDIHEDVKRQIRQNSGFGCVVCACAFYEYEHFDPEFVDALEHDPAKMTLLCPTCHKKKGKWLSKETIAAAILDPKPKKIGYAFDTLDPGIQPTLILGNWVGRNVRSLLVIEGEELFGIAAPEEPGTPFRINAKFSNLLGNPVLEIRNNEWRLPSTSWDARTEGAVTTVRNAPESFGIVLRSLPNVGVQVERLHMKHRGITISAILQKPTVITDQSGQSMAFDQCEISNFGVGFHFYIGGGFCIGEQGGVDSKSVIRRATVLSAAEAQKYHNMARIRNPST